MKNPGLDSMNPLETDDKTATKQSTIKACVYLIGGTITQYFVQAASSAVNAREYELWMCVAC